MKIATWNVNSVRVRAERLAAVLGRHRPDALCLQELKVVDTDFPWEVVRAAGYRGVIHGQKTYNGVAILTLDEPTDVLRGLDDGVDDPQARLVAARVGGVRVVSVYVPNGAELGSEKYAYKLAWLTRLRAWLERHCDPREPLALCGDFNVAPDERDVHDPALWLETVLFHPAVREALRGVLSWGLADTFRLHHEQAGVFSWWDYRNLAFPRNEGLRIDHVFVTPPLATRCTGCVVDRDERKGKQPSDHAPVIATFGP